MSADENRSLVALSDGLAAAVATAGRHVVRVEGRQRAHASGVQWGAGDLVVTADHVLERDENINVGLPDGQHAPAVLVGRASDYDLALLRLPAGEGSAATIGTTPRIGDIVLGVARPGEDGLQASWGVVSAVGGPAGSGRGRAPGGYVRTGITMYPGFSGGALVDARGAIVGVLSSHLGGDAGLAVPAEVVTRIVETLVQHGHVRRAYLGFRSQPVPLPPGVAETLGRSQESGLLVMSLEQESPAERATLLIGDIVITFGDQPVATPEDLQALLATAVVGTPVRLGVLRGGQPVDLTVTPGDRP